MSRHKNFTAKFIADAPPGEKLAAAIYGDNRNTEAIELLKLWQKSRVITLHSGEMRRMGEKKYQRRIADELRQRCAVCLGRMADHVDRAIKTGNAAFLRAFADAIEKDRQPIDRLRMVVGRILEFVTFVQKTGGAWAKAQQARGTLATYHKAVEFMLGWHVNKDHLGRICKEMGLPLTPDKKGRPRGSKDIHHGKSQFRRR